MNLEPYSCMGLIYYDIETGTRNFGCYTKFRELIHFLIHERIEKYRKISGA